MLFNFTRPVQICFKPSDVKKFKFNRSSFAKGVNRVADEVLKHPYFKKLVLSGAVDEVGQKSFDAGVIVTKDKRLGSQSAKALKKASSASVPEGFDLQDTDAIVAGIK
jgi:hypothetical protein